MTDDRLSQNARKTLDLALRLRAKGELPAAEKALLAFLSDIPEPSTAQDQNIMAEVQYAMGEILDELRNKGEALQHFRMALKLNPGMTRAIVKIVESTNEEETLLPGLSTDQLVEYLAEGEKTVARLRVVKHLREILRIRLSDPVENATERLPLLKSLLQRCPQATFARFYLGRAHYLLERFEDAADILATIPEPAASDPAVLNLLAASLEKARRLPEAIENYRKSLQRDPEQPGIHFRCGRALLASAHCS